ncbi:uncharacterized protein LOC136096480 [Hydra vulgaris]|uniref:uncharacterized protein LOC136096480 n=1 Tax=Hydra vulgaris TaxID=6087 RepID=UPI0032EA5601
MVLRKRCNINYMLDSNNDESGLDSSVGGMSSGEEEELNKLLVGGCESQTQLCTVNNYVDEIEQSVLSSERNSDSNYETNTILTIKFCPESSVQMILIHGIEKKTFVGKEFEKKQIYSTEQESKACHKRQQCKESVMPENKIKKTKAQIITNADNKPKVS